MNLINLIRQLDSLWGNIGIFIVLITLLMGSFLIYRKSKKREYYYCSKGVLFILIAFLIRMAKLPLTPGSLLDLVGVGAFVFFLVLAGYNIFYLADKKKSKGKAK